jgi:capsid assembly protease
MSEHRYPALRRYVSETPWALLPSTLLMVREVLGRRLDGDRLSAEELAEITAASKSRSATPSQGAVAVLPLWGVLAPHQVNDLSSGPTQALDSWGQLFDALVNDPSIGTIVLDVDSPGGSVDLVPETAAKVRAANARKEIVAVANTRAASAAYWIASQAGQLVVSPSGAVGSIGVYAAHQDISRQLDEDGVTMTLISAADHKTDGNPFEPLSDEARATIQANVDAYYGMFVSDVADGRGVDPGVVEKKFGQGKMMLAVDAVKVGMADGVGTLEQTLDRLLAGKPATGRRSARADAELDLSAAVSTALGRPGLRADAIGRLVLATVAAEELESDSGGITPAIHAPTAADVDGDRRLVARAARGRLVPSLNDSGRDSAAGSAAPGGDNTRTKE